MGMCETSSCSRAVRLLGILNVYVQTNRGGYRDLVRENVSRRGSYRHKVGLLEQDG